MLSRKDIDTLATLARLEVSDAEKDALQKEFAAILDYVGEIQKVSSTEILKDKILADKVHNVFREDKDPHLSGEFSEDLLSEAPRRQDNFVKVKRIL
jgi:aspartyl-tRNA(Asn)/glutamyl-tRNA(Gln) amidotransferase subunit C